MGTTNRCSLRDYADAIGPQTAFILKVHPSNFVISGFTSAVGVADLATLGRRSSSTSDPGCSRRIRCCPTSPTPPPRCGDGAALVTAYRLHRVEQHFCIKEAALEVRLRRALDIALHPQGIGIQPEERILRAVAMNVGLLNKAVDERPSIRDAAPNILLFRPSRIVSDAQFASL